MTSTNTDRRPVLRRELLGRLVTSLRVRHCVTQTELGVRTGLTQSAVDRLESGKSLLPVETLLDLVDALDTTLGLVVWLFEILTEDLVADGYEIVPSPPRGARGGELPEPSMTGRILAGYVTGWLEQNRELLAGGAAEWTATWRAEYRAQPMPYIPSALPVEVPHQ